MTEEEKKQFFERIEKRTNEVADEDGTTTRLTMNLRCHPYSIYNSNRYLCHVESNTVR